MKSEIKASFIPKKPVAQSTPISNMAHRGNGIDLIMLVSIILLVIAIVLSVGVFLYNGFANSQLEAKKTSLERSRDNFQPALIKDFEKLSNRINVAETILENHIAPSIFLDALERDTLESVQLTSFKFKLKNNDLAEFAIKGKTNSVNSVALQSSKFGESEIIKNSIFSDIDLVNGGVVFNVTGEVDLNAIRFTNLINGSFQQNPNIQDLFNNTQSQTNTQTENFNDLNDFGDFGNLQ